MNDSLMNLVKYGVTSLFQCLLVTLVLIIGYSVAARYLFRNPVDWAVEASIYLLIYFGCLGLAYALLVGKHIRVTFFHRLLSERLKFIIDLISMLGGLILTSLMGGYGVLLTVEYIQRGLLREEFGTPFWHTFVAIPIALLAMAAIYGYQVYLLLRSDKTRKVIDNDEPSRRDQSHVKVVERLS